MLHSGCIDALTMDYLWFVAKLGGSIDRRLLENTVARLQHYNICDIPYSGHRELDDHITFQAPAPSTAGICRRYLSERKNASLGTCAVNGLGILSLPVRENLLLLAQNGGLTVARDLDDSPVYELHLVR